MRSLRLGRSIGYGLFALIVLAAVLYVRVPANFLERFIVSRITEGRPDLAVTLADARLRFPPGLRMDHLVIRFLDRGSTSVEFERISASAAVSQLFFGRLVFLVEARAYGGDIRGNVSFVHRFSVSGPVRADLTFSDVNLGGCSYAEALSGRRIDGLLSGALLYDGRVEDAVNGRGRLDITLRDGSIRLLNPVFGLERLDFSRADGEAALENRTLNIRSLRLAGTGLQGTLSGQVFLENDVLKSRLDLKGTLTLAGGNTGPQPIALTGPLGDPAVQFL